MERISEVKFSKITDFCPVCGNGTKGILEVNGEKRMVGLACKCNELTPVDQREQAIKRAFGNRQPMGNFNSDDESNSAVSLACKEYANSFGTICKGKVNGLLLFGEPRQGKTFMAEAVAMEVLNSKHSVLFRTASEIVQAFQYDDKAEVNKLRDSVKSVELLVIDDLGAQRSTAFADEIIFTIIDERYSARKPILVTTNATIEEMAGTDDVTLQRCYGRLIERCKLVQVDSGRSCVN